MDLNLTGKHALVCGGSEGIGRAAAHELACLSVRFRSIGPPVADQ